MFAKGSDRLLSCYYLRPNEFPVPLTWSQWAVDGRRRAEDVAETTKASAPVSRLRRAP